MTHLILLFPLLVAQLFAVGWYVSPNGNDAWTGRFAEPNADKTDGPFATLTKARDTIRPIPGERVVHIREGLYELPQGLKFTADESGRAYAQIVWQA